MLYANYAREKLHNLTLVKEARGYPCVFLKSKGKNLKDYKIYGNSIQNGTPTPDTPIEVESVGEKTKNLFNINNLTNTHYVNKQDNKTIIISKYGASSVQTLGELCPELKIGDNAYITFVSNAEVNGSRLGLLYLNGANVNWRNKTSLTITQAHLDSRLTFYCTRNDNVSVEAYYKNIQIELDGITNYDSYGYKIPVKVSNETEEITTNIYLDEPLRKLGRYADYIDFENKKVVRHIYNDFITKADSKSSMSGTYALFLSIISKKPLYQNYKGICMSNKFASTDVAYSNLKNYGGIIQSYVTSGGGYRVAYTFPDTNITTVAQANEKIGDGFEVYYVLAKPIEETIDLPNIPTLKGTTIIETDTNISPSDIWVKYISK